jgi:hypothetical protein
MPFGWRTTNGNGFDAKFAKENNSNGKNRSRSFAALKDDIVKGMTQSRG